MEEINYPLASSTWGEEEIAALQGVIESGKFTMGEYVKKFETDFAHLVGSKYAVMVNSGSSANLALMSSVKFLSQPLLKPGDEIIVPAVSWSTTYYPVDQIGCTLSFVDIDIDTLNIDPQKIIAAITPKTKAILVVNLLGNPANWVELNKIAETYGLILLEDNCESLGGSLNGKFLGTFGVGGTYSTFFSHHISTMEGGIVTTDDEEIYQVLKSLRAHGWTRDLPDTNLVFNKSGKGWDDSFRFVLPGYNLRPLEMQAATGIEQIKKLPAFVETRRNNGGIFQEMMAEFENIHIQREVGVSSWFGFSMVLRGKLRGKREEFINKLTQFGVESRPIVAGNFTRNPVIKYLSHANIPALPAADEVHDNGLFVGNHHYDLSLEINQLRDALRQFISEVKSN